MFELELFGSKCTVLKKALAILLGLFGAHSDSAPGILRLPASPLYAPGPCTDRQSRLGEISGLWAKIYIVFDAIASACRKWLEVGFRKVQRVHIILVPKKNQNIS